MPCYAPILVLLNAAKLAHLQWSSTDAEGGGKRWLGSEPSPRGK